VSAHANAHLDAPARLQHTARGAQRQQLCRAVGVGTGSVELLLAALFAVREWQGRLLLREGARWRRWQLLCRKAARRRQG
jgi:hypothetical protein